MKKKLELYELVLLLKFTSTEAEINARTQLYKNFLTERGSQVVVKNQGKRSLSYPIKDFETAYSIQIVSLNNRELIKLLNTELQRDEFLLRPITTKLNSSLLCNLLKA